MFLLSQACHRPQTEANMSTRTLPGPEKQHYEDDIRLQIQVSTGPY